VQRGWTDTNRSSLLLLLLLMSTNAELCVSCTWRHVTILVWSRQAHLFTAAAAAAAAATAAAADATAAYVTVVFFIDVEHARLRS
jgi:hypothetical protein